MLIGYLIYLLVKNLEMHDKILKIYLKIDLLVFTIKICVIIYFILLFLITPCKIQGSSMEETLYSNENVLCVNNFNLTPKHGDIIVFCAKSNMFYIKRVVAKPKDVVSYNKDDFDLFINGEFVENITPVEFDNILRSINIEDSNTFEFIIPKNKFLVLGDNRGNSEDSRDLGLIDKSKIFGIVKLRFFPFNKITTY